MKKSMLIIALVCVVLLLLGALLVTGCGESKDEQEGVDTGETQEKKGEETGEKHEQEGVDTGGAHEKESEETGEEYEEKYR